MIGEKIEINASPEVVFEAIRMQRNGNHRKLQSFDGKVAIIQENLEGVPIFGKVECIWEEVEDPYNRIDFKMLSSTKFKESHGAFILTAAGDGNGTTLELQVHMDPGISLPFADEIARASTSKDSKNRLEHIKKVAESSSGLS